MKILVTGMGVITSIGNNLAENINSLKNSSGGISQIEGVKNMRKPFLGGQIKITNKEFKYQLGLAGHPTIQRSTLLGLIAANEAWGNRKPNPDLRTGLIYGTTVGGINIGDQLLIDNNHRTLTQKLNYSNTHDNVFSTDFIAKKLGITDYKATISTACSSSANSILVGARLIKANVLDRVLVGGAEAISNYLLNGFDSLQLYDNEKCKPFDNKRKGLNLGEAGCFMVIESESSAKRTGQTKLAELIGWGNACDAFHQTASSPEGTGAVLAIQQALKIAGVSTNSIDYINAHGTGTPNNDLSESQAIKTIFGNKIPPFSSTKSYIGHTLAAAGGIEAIYSILAIQHGLIFPNLNYSEAMSEFDFRPETKLVKNKSIKTVLSNSFGFGGNCTELIFTE